MQQLSNSRFRCALALAVALALLFVVDERSFAAGPRPQADIAGQSELVDRALSEVTPSSDGVRHLYFVGFAGYGAAAVFKREVVAVRELFNERFGTKGRSLALINHTSTLNDVPLASPQNLERVLQHLGRVMDKARDTLFLFLTSHGERALLAVEMPGVRLAHLTPAMLKSMLDRSGIKNSVIVVSACHSGSFIPALASPTRLVIAAARADRTSFGCDDKREWTYFGDAYFNKALREETSFKRAFERARQLVQQWEIERAAHALAAADDGWGSSGGERVAALGGISHQDLNMVLVGGIVCTDIIG